MGYYKHIIIGSVAALVLIGCGESAEVKLGTLSTDISVRMMDVGQNYTNAQAVEKDAITLTLPKYINANYPLPKEGIAGSDINWTLLNSGDFNITDHTLMIEDRAYEQYAKLSAFINYDLNKSDVAAHQTKEFCLTILPEALTDCDKVNQDITMVEGNHFPMIIDLNGTDAYKDCGLLNKAPNDSNITWKLCDNEVFEINTTTNKVQLVDPQSITEKKCATIQGTFQHGEITKDAYFQVVVYPKQ
jgi:hypothetical protein